MEIVYTLDAKEDIEYWNKTGNSACFKKICNLIESISNNSYEGINKPEPLKHQLTGTWSRQIDREHRLIYKVSDNIVIILDARGHYAK